VSSPKRLVNGFREFHTRRVEDAAGCSVVDGLEEIAETPPKVPILSCTTNILANFFVDRIAIIFDSLILSHNQEFGPIMLAGHLYPPIST